MDESQHIIGGIFLIALGLWIFVKTLTELKSLLHCWHDFDLWSEGKVRHESSSFSSSSTEYQTRKCKKCGLEQAREIIKTKLKD